MTALHRRLACALALALPGAVVGACAAPPAVVPAAAEARAAIQATARVVTAARSGTAGRRLQAIVPVYTTSDVNLVELRLFAVAGATETLLATVDVPAGYFAIPATFSRLRANSTYRLRARAYVAGGRTLAQLISDDATSFVNVATADDDRATWASCPVRLIDKPFGGQAIGGVAITDGGLTPGLRGLVLTLAGSSSGAVDAQGPLARFNEPSGVTFDGLGGFWVADAANHLIRLVGPAGDTTLFAGDGSPGFVNDVAANASFNSPRGLEFNGDGTLYVADTGNHAIRSLDPVSGAVTTLAGDGTPGFADDGIGLTAQFNAPEGLLVDGTDAYVADTGNHRIRHIAGAGSHPVTTIAGGAGASFVDDALGLNARFSSPRGLAFDGPGDFLYVADTGNHRIRRIDMLDPAHPVTTIAGGGTPGDADGAGASATFNGPRGLAIDGDRLYVVDTGNHRIRAIDLKDGGTFAVHTVAGDAAPGASDGLGANGKFNAPRGIAIDGNDGSLVIADTDNHRVRRVR